MKILTFLSMITLAMLASKPILGAERESYYSGLICEQEYNGYEQSLPSGLRPDCQTPFVIMEFDWATRSKSYQCIGQSLIYAQESGLIPVCILLARDDQELEFGNSLDFSEFGIILHVIDTRPYDP